MLFLQGTVYLVKWSNYPTYESTWEPAHHIPESLRRTYLFPTIDEDDQRLLQAASLFENAIKTRLTSRISQIPVDFDLDIYRYCFNTDQSVMLENETSIQKLPMSKHWKYVLNKFGRGNMITKSDNYRNYQLYRNI